MSIFKSRLKLVKGTRFLSFLFIGCSIAIAAGILWAANMYYNIDTGEVVMEEIQRVTGLTRAIGGLIVKGTATQSLPSGVSLEIAADDVLLSAANQVLRFSGGTGYYVGFKATTSISSNKTYILPDHDTNPPATDYVLTWQSGDQLQWKPVTGTAGIGDITAVGDCSSGDCFTSGGTQGGSLWFNNSGFQTKLTTATLTGDHTITLPDATGTVALGTGTANYVAYWSDSNTLTSEQYLDVSRGGIGESSAGWNGMVQVVGGDWGTITGTANYVAYWSDSNTISAEEFLATSRGGLGADVTAGGAGEILYSTGATTYDTLAAGTSGQLLKSGGTSAPSWDWIYNLVGAGSGLSDDDSSPLTIKLGGTLSENTTISQGNFDMVFDLTGSGDFKVQDAGSDLFTVTADGRILFKTGYPIAESGKQVLREMIPILGFDLPVQTASTSYVKISKTLENYPFSSTPSGANRVHKLIFRYAASTTNPIIWRVSTSTGQTYSSSTLPVPSSTSLEQGNAYITTTTIPTDGTDWWLDIRTQDSADVVRVFQIFLAAYDELQ